MKATYLTFNEPVNGIYISQVIEVANKLCNSGIETRIVALFSLRDFFKNRRTLKKLYQNSIALPAFPKLKYWKLNGIWLRTLPASLKNQNIICRGPLATNLAIDNLKSPLIIYDGRGAVWAEQQEYGVFNGTGIEKDLFEIEKKAVTQSQKQIAVSSHLISYWKENFNFSGNSAKVIPCALDENKLKNDTKIPELIENFLNKANEDNLTITVFSGGNGKWQQIDKICEFAVKVMQQQTSLVFLFLCPPDQNVQHLANKYPGRIAQSLVTPQLVHPILQKCDYGIVLREQNTTNRVASPVKIAEYLFAGLKVIISPNIGDYSAMIEENNLGIISSSNTQTPYLPKPDISEKQRNSLFAKKYLSKSAVDYSHLFKRI